jgi:hypothetical protein
MLKMITGLALRLAPRLGLVVCAFSLGCGSRSAFDGTNFHKSGVDYRVGRLGADWRRVQIKGNDLAFHRAAQGAVSVNATCREYEDVPPQVLLNQLLFGTTDRKYLVDEEVTIDGRGARHAVVEAELDGVPVRLEMYVLARSGCVFDLSYVSDRSAPAARAFAEFVEAFHVESVRRD